VDNGRYPRLNRRTHRTEIHLTMKKNHNTPYENIFASISIARCDRRSWSGTLGTCLRILIFPEDAVIMYFYEKRGHSQGLLAA
jgi:hypothetical protein